MLDSRFCIFTSWTLPLSYLFYFISSDFFYFGLIFVGFISAFAWYLHKRNHRILSVYDVLLYKFFAFDFKVLSLLANFRNLYESILLAAFALMKFWKSCLWVCLAFCQNHNFGKNTLYRFFLFAGALWAYADKHRRNIK